jgi:hypothetical protein
MMKLHSSIMLIVSTMSAFSSQVSDGLLLAFNPSFLAVIVEAGLAHGVYSSTPSLPVEF